MRLKAILFAILLLPLHAPGAAQTVVFDQARVPMVELAGPWRFHLGDDARWAESGFDDSGWSLITVEKPWSEQGYSGYTGLAWYRLQVVLPVQHGPLAVYLPGVHDSCQVFANGRLIGQAGGLPPHQNLVSHNNVVFPVPDGILAPRDRLVIAIRVWKWPVRATRRGGVYPAPRLGDAQAIETWRQLNRHDLYWQLSDAEIALAGDLLAVLAGLGLFSLRRKEREYFFFGAGHVAWTGYMLLVFYSTFRQMPYFSVLICFACLSALGEWLRLEFYVALFGLRKSAIYWAGLVCVVIYLTGYLLAISLSPSSFDLLNLCAHFAYLCCLVALLLRAWRERKRDALVLLIPNALFPLLAFSGLIASLPFVPSTWAGAIYPFLEVIIHWPFPISINDVISNAELFAVLTILVLRFARSRRNEERFKGELEAAREVQRVLIPEEIPAIPGFAVEAVYKPAGQVGGDFFQIIARDGGGALIVIGDVSGKGMPAGMTVSLLVGTFRTLAYYVTSPGEILAAMNRRMLARSRDGFTTCLVLRLDADGTLTMANAGHLAPYVSGKEMSLENGLPLGLMAEASYAERTVRLGPEDTLTLMTDGVVEARSALGELFGFERTAAIADEAAGRIAGAAQAFGQEDDITVIRLVREPDGGEVRVEAGVVAPLLV